MKYPEMVKATFLKRVTRFSAILDVQGREELAALPDPGRMKELLIPGVETRLIPQDKPGRKTRFDFALIKHRGKWVSLNSHLPNDLFEEAIRKRSMAPFRAESLVRREVTIGKSRLDFLLTGPKGQTYVEVKSATLVENGEAKFPDAPTERGAKHLRELSEIVRNGGRAAAVFVIQRSDASTLSPNTAMDQRFSDALVQADKTGVGVFAFRCFVGEKSISIRNEVPVILPK
jgi:sugar fermentation stimulation protein A